jgi:hypothetical protein
MQFKAVTVSTLVLGITLLPTTLAGHFPCVSGYNHNRGDDCAKDAYYGCSHNAKHLVSYLYLVFLNDAIYITKSLSLPHDGRLANTNFSYFAKTANGRESTRAAPCVLGIKSFVGAIS